MVRVFSFCLYGPPNPRYYPTPMLQNIELARIHFPSWKVYIYVSPDVDPVFVEHLKSLSNVVIKHTGSTGDINMVHRFFTIDEPDVEVMFVRDADSHIHWRDRWAIRDFLQRNYSFHVIRDHPEHKVHIPGGLWGMRKVHGLSIRNEYIRYTDSPPREIRNAHDQDFLSDQIYPKALPLLLVHVASSNLILSRETGITFPSEWTDSLYCGRRDGSVFTDRTILSFLRK